MNVLDLLEEIKTHTVRTMALGMIERALCVHDVEKWDYFWTFQTEN